MQSALSMFSTPLNVSNVSRGAAANGDCLANLETRFIENWEKLAGSFGMHEGLGQVHAVLYLSTAPLSAQALAEQLDLDLDYCRHRLSMLESYGIVRELPADTGDTVFEAERDPWSWFLLAVRERARREFLPLLESIRTVNTLAQEAKKAAHRDDPAHATRIERIGSFTHFIDQMASFLELFSSIGAGPLTATMRIATKFRR